MKQAVGFSIWERVRRGRRGVVCVCGGVIEEGPRCLCQLIFGTLASSSAPSPWLYKQTTARSSLTIKHGLIKPSPTDRPALSSRMCSELIELLKIYLHSSSTSTARSPGPSPICLRGRLTLAEKPAAAIWVVNTLLQGRVALQGHGGVFSRLSLCCALTCRRHRPNPPRGKLPVSISVSTRS